MMFSFSGLDGGRVLGLAFVAFGAIVSMWVLAGCNDDSDSSGEDGSDVGTSVLSSGSDVLSGAVEASVVAGDDASAVVDDVPSGETDAVDSVSDGDVSGGEASSGGDGLVATTHPYEPNNVMFRVFAGFDLTTGFQPSNDRVLKALEEIKANNDASQVLVLIESMRFQYSNEVIEAIGDVLRSLTGESFAGSDWRGWSEWAGLHRKDYPPPEDYLEWKLNYLRQIDSRFSQFLSPAGRGRSDIDLTEIEWGGVIPDGIPDLMNPGHVSADDEGADYLEDDERVIGVSINGEHRAYPLRIVNAHELVNDVLGGEPLALTW